jgi:hypothetical protein
MSMACGSDETCSILIGLVPVVREMAETAGLVELDCLARIEDRLRFRHPPAAVPSRQIGAAKARYRLGKAL